MTEDFCKSEKGSGSFFRDLSFAVVLAVAFLWLQLFYSCSTLWTHSEYYGYGWYVPLIATFFFYRRWKDSEFGDRELRSVPSWLFPLLALILLPLLLPIRAIGNFDPTWRVPILIQAVAVVLVSHGLLGAVFGWKKSLMMAPVTIYALSSVPYPFQFENWMIRKMTGLVIYFTVEVFGWMGRPVTAIGERLESAGTVVEVSEGCSGIRSFQSLLNASLFFGELFWLSVWKRGFLLIGGLFFATIVNAGRAVYLATIRFDDGAVAFDEAHDLVGYMAFCIAAALLLVMAFVLKQVDLKHKAIVTTVGEEGKPL
ncbi:MAG: exosortase/archaeosortase family protein [Akkermansiaceae bacterium]|nr:exosortase/archaeosortase family protein [Akkermansiaceae bacterium]